MKLIMKAKSIDLFNQNISLNFDKIGDKFSTSYGIIVSFFIYLTVGLYSGIRSKILIENSNSNISSVNQPIDIIKTLGNVNINQTKMLFYL